MPQFRTYPQIFSVVPTDAVVIDRIGVGTVYADVQNFGPGNGGVLVPPGNILLAPNTFYGVKTSLGAYSLTLPARAQQALVAYLEVADLDNNAGVNNITVNAAAGDAISDHGVTSSSYAIRISNTMTRFIVNSTSWTAITFGT